MKVLAQLTADGGLAIGSRALSLGRLSSTARDSVARLPTTVLLEVELAGDAVVALGDVKPHPRVTALRAVIDNRPHLTLEAIAALGALVEDDLEVRVAEVKALLQSGLRQQAEAAFLALTRHPSLDRKTLEQAFLALERDAQSVAACSERFVSCFEALVGDGPVRCAALRLVSFERWPASLLARVISEGAKERSVSPGDVAELLPLAQRLATLDPESGRAAEADLARLQVKLEKAEARRRAKTLASRPDFTPLKLPAHLGEAWLRAYEDDNRLGFLLVKTLDELKKLATRLVKDLDQTMPHRAEQLLPFADDGDGRFFVLDLSRPLNGDFPVLVICKGSDGESWENSMSSAAWLAEDGKLSF
ncbi:MAG: hypothetical protein ABTQ32_34390 [Myxococcaceae bacterium]